MELYFEREFRDGDFFQQRYGIADASGNQVALDKSVEGIAATIRYNIIVNVASDVYKNKQETTIHWELDGKILPKINVKIRSPLTSNELEELAMRISHNPSMPMSNESVTNLINLRAGIIANQG